MNVTTLVELAKVSPYLVLPALFIFILWKVYRENNSFIQNVIKEKTEQFENINKTLRQMGETMTAYITTFEKDNRQQHETNHKEIMEKVGNIEDRLEVRIENSIQKIDSLRLDIAKGDIKK